MPRNRTSFCGIVWLIVFVASTHAQVVAPVEIKDPQMRSLQLANMDELKAAGAEIASTSFEYPFYMSRKLDLDQQQQKSADQRSIRFERYEGKTASQSPEITTRHTAPSTRARSSAPRPPFKMSRCRF